MARRRLCSVVLDRYLKEPQTFSPEVLAMLAVLSVLDGARSAGTKHSQRVVKRTAMSPGAFLNGAHNRLASILLAIIADGPSIVGKSPEVEYGLAPRCPEVTAHPVRDHVLPLGI